MQTHLFENVSSLVVIRISGKHFVEKRTSIDGMFGFFVCFVLFCFVFGLLTDAILHLSSRKVICRRKSLIKVYFAETFGNQSGRVGISSEAVAKVVWYRLQISMSTLIKVVSTLFKFNKLCEGQ